AGHDVGGGDAAGNGHANTRVVGEDGVLGAQTGLHGAGPFVAVAVGRHARTGVDADVRVRVHQAGDDRLAGGVDHFRVFGDGRVGAADGDDLALVKDENAVVDARGGDRQEGGPAE